MEFDHGLRCRLDRGRAEKQRHIFAFGPDGRQIGIMRRAWIARLAGRVDAQALIPIADIHDEAHRGAMGDPPVCQPPACMHRRRGIAAERERSDIETIRTREDGMLEQHLVEVAPVP